MVKRKTKSKKKNVDIDIKVSGVDRLIKKHKGKNSGKIKCYSWHGNNCCRGFGYFGAALAMILSYTRSESILWAIIHGILNWFYVIYRIIQVWGWI